MERAFIICRRGRPPRLLGVMLLGYEELLLLLPALLALLLAAALLLLLTLLLLLRPLPRGVRGGGTTLLQLTPVFGERGSCWLLLLRLITPKRRMFVEFFQF